MEERSKQTPCDSTTWQKIDLTSQLGFLWSHSPNDSCFELQTSTIQFKRRFEMSEPIYKFFTGRFLPDWYQLSQEEQKSLLAKLNEALEKLGAKRTILCNAYWSTDQWLWAGVEEFPNIEAVQKFMATLQELNWGRYAEGSSVLGTKMER
jgi:hypothetical protein